VPINKNRRTERRAVNALRSLMERHDFIVQEIDGGNDHGEDLYVSFTERGERTGDTIAIQVKGGASHSSKDGFRVPIRRHLSYWSNSNTPVYCVAQDPESEELFWANASAQIRQAASTKKSIKSIKVPMTDSLNDETVALFALRARLYISETGDFHKFLGRISGVQFDSSDYLAYFENIHGEQMIFRQQREVPFSTLLHADLDWEPIAVTEANIAFVKPARTFQRAGIDQQASGPATPTPTLNDVILSRGERMWIEACFEESRWAREFGRESKFDLPRDIPPILYSPLKESEVMARPWRQDQRVNDLMEKFIDLGYAYWPDQYARPDQVRLTRESAWHALQAVARELKARKVPDYYLMGNRGRLTRSDLRELLRSIARTS
jgi:hypothetical protein